MPESKNVPSIIVRNRDRTVVITRSFSVEGVPNVAAQYSGKPFHPDVIVVKLQDGAFHHAQVSGPRVLLGGRLGRDRARKAWYSIRELDRDAPAWVKDAVAEVLRMEATVTR